MGTFLRDDWVRAAKEDLRGRGGAGERLACLSYAALRFGVEIAVEGLRKEERDLRVVGVFGLVGVLGRVETGRR